jgi:S1-C subfamily serine protease
VALFAFVALSAGCLSPTLPQHTAQAGPNGDGTTVDLAGLEQKFEAVARQVAPSVVAISAACTAIEGEDVLRTDSLNAEKLDGLLARTTRTVGTGFVVDSDGYILTNEHVIGEAQQLWVTTDDRKVYPAIVVGSDPRQDLAVLKIPATGLPVVTFAKPETVRRGMWTIALGNPYGLAMEGELAMSVGIVSATSRSLPKLSSKENRLYNDLIQTTAEINPGNSGGPLFDLNGDVIGINTAVILPQKQTNGIGFAMPVTPTIMATVADLKQGREIVYGYLGVLVSTPTARERRAAGMTAEGGARIDSIEPDSPAGKTSLKPGDIITDVNGQPIADSDHFVRMIGRMPVDQVSAVSVARSGHAKALAVDVTPRRRPMPSVAITRESQRMRWRGMLLAPIPANWAGGKQDAKQQGLIVIGLEKDSPFAKRVSQGSVITSIAGKAVSSLADLQRIVDGTLPEVCEISTFESAAMASTAQ